MRFGVLQTIGGPNSRSPRLCPPPAGKAECRKDKDFSVAEFAKNFVFSREIGTSESLGDFRYGLTLRHSGKAEGNGSIRKCQPLVRQNKVGGGQAPTNLPLCPDFFHDIAMDVGQTKVAARMAICQSLMV